MTNDVFRVVVPAELEKSKDGMWRVRGLASTPNRDRQNELIDQAGLDLSLIDAKKGILNVDHLSGPENTIGVIEGYKRTPQGLYIEGKLFKNHVKAQAFQQIMSSLDKSDHPIVGLSVEGKVLERDAKDPSIIKRCRIGAVALTMSPVNTDTYVDLTKSLNAAQEIEFDCQEKDSSVSSKEEAIFTASQVLSIVEKALGIGAGGAEAPADRTGGDALTQSNMKEKKKKLKKMSADMYKSNMLEILSKLQELYPNNSRSELWSAVEDRMNQKFLDAQSK